MHLVTFVRKYNQDTKSARLIAGCKRSLNEGRGFNSQSLSSWGVFPSNIHYINTFLNSFPAQYIHNEKFSGIPCYVFQLKTTIEKKVNIYTLTVKQEDGVPMRYEMLGYDTLLGSHYDKYIVLYTSFVVGVPADDVFEIPSSMYKIYLLT